MIKKILTAGAFASLVFATNAQALLINLEDATNGGGFFGTVEITDVSVNQVNVVATIADPVNAGLTNGDILGLWFDVADESVLGDISAANGNPMGIVTGLVADANDVNSLGGNNNLNGTGESDFDLGIALGSNGGPDFFQTLSFDLLATGISAATFEGQRVGMRVQSIDSPSFGNGASSKLIGSGNTPPPPPPPPVDVAEPGALTLLGLGLVLLSGLRRRRNAV